MRLIERIPELEVLRVYPDLRNVIDQDNPHAIYRALLLARLFRRAKGHRELLDELLSRRRLYLKPIQRAPVLFTYNGIGFTVYGRDDRSLDDGSFITTHFFTLVFVPLYPLCQYLAFEGDTARSYRFVGKVPFSLPLFLWNRIWALGVMVGMVIAGLNAWQNYRHQQVWIANPLDQVVLVDIDGVHAEIAATGADQLTVPVGRHHLVITTAKNQPVEEGTIEVHAGRKIPVWNVLGLAPVTQRKIVYVADGVAESTIPPPAEPVTRCNQSWFEWERADYVFSAHPARANMGKNVKSVRHQALELADGGLAKCAALSAGLPKEQGRVFSSHLRQALQILGPREELLRMTSDFTRRFDGIAAADQFARDLHQKYPADVEVSRLYQDAFRFGDDRSKLVQEYRALHKQQPNSVDQAYLLSRLLPDADAEALLQPLFERFPTHRYLPRGLGYAALNLGHFALATVAFEALVQAGRRELVEELLMSYIGEGRLSNATALLDKQLATLGREGDLRSRLDLAILDARLSRVEQANYQPALVNRVAAEQPSLQAFILASAGVKRDTSDIQEELPIWRETMKVRFAIQQGPKPALVAIEAASEDALAQLPPEDLLLVYGEAKRVHQEPLIERLKQTEFGKVMAPRIDNWLARGEQLDEVARGDLTTRAALEFSRSRLDGLAASERERLQAAAATHDLLPSDLTIARSTWKP